MSSKRKMKVGVLMAVTVLLAVLAGSAAPAGGKPRPPPPPSPTVDTGTVYYCSQGAIWERPLQP